MNQYVYSPYTGEIINTVAPAIWMNTTNIIPPIFDATSTSVFFINGAWIISPHNPVLTAEILTKSLNDYQNAARNALLLTDITFIRIQEAITFGTVLNTDATVVEWINYRKALRTEIKAVVLGALPTKPINYPTGI